MFSPFDQLQVLDAIVVSVSVFVMHVFGRQQRSADMTLHHHPMLPAPFAFDLDLAIRRAAAGGWRLRKAKSVLGQVHFGKARARAVLRGWDAVFWNSERDPAALTHHVSAAVTATADRRSSTGARAQLLVDARTHKRDAAVSANVAVDRVIRRCHEANDTRGYRVITSLILSTSH